LPSALPHAATADACAAQLRRAVGKRSKPLDWDKLQQSLALWTD
jgi:mannitol/fructose-specific phosphotransferase system IIA component (Ntr-type)